MIIRVFPRRTRATPDDCMVRVGVPPTLFDEADEVHISVSFTWDLPLAERLAEQWRIVAPVKIGGPATGERGDEFVSGMYLKKGYVITSRGCPNRCWFCSVWKREGDTVREFPITDGFNVLDDNLLACSDDHIKSVFSMLKGKRDIEFTGGLEAKRLRPWIAEELFKLKPNQLFFAYDTPDDFEPLMEAGKLLHSAGFSKTSHRLRSYVLCGYPKDTIEDAEERMNETMKAGFMPMAMLWRDNEGHRDKTWARWARQWIRPAAMNHKFREVVAA